jgi:hypothetical protein
MTNRRRLAVPRSRPGDIGPPERERV